MLRLAKLEFAFRLLVYVACVTEYNLFAHGLAAEFGASILCVKCINKSKALYEMLFHKLYMKIN